MLGALFREFLDQWPLVYAAGNLTLSKYTASLKIHSQFPVLGLFMEAHSFLIVVFLISRHGYYSDIQPSVTAYLIPPLIKFLLFCFVLFWFFPVAFIQSGYKTSHSIAWLRIFPVSLKHKFV